MKRSVRILRRAESDLRELRDYLGDERRAGPGDSVDRILAAAASLTEHAERGARPRDARLESLGYRFLVVDRYLVFYKTSHGTVRVYRIVHGARRYRHLL